MDLVLNGNKQRKIVGKEDIPFSLEVSGLYLIEVTARTQGEKQLGMSDDEDLRVEIDGRRFPQLKNSQRYFDSPASFSGGSLHGLKKTVFFILLLDSGKHTISLISDISAIVEQIRVSRVSNSGNSQVNFLRDITAEDGDRRDWITFVLVDMGLKDFSVALTLKKRFIDSDDVKIVIDGNIQRNYRSILHKFWYFIASIFTPEDQMEHFTLNFPRGLHYLELWVDRMPTLNSAAIGVKNNTDDKLKRYKDNKFNRDYNRLDDYIIKGTDFWNNFFLNQIYPPPKLLDPSLVKAIIYRESLLGYDPDQNIVDVMQVWDPKNPAQSTLLGDTPEREFVSPERIEFIHKFYPERITPKVESKEESIFWGVRWLYHKAQYLPDDKKPYRREWLSWKDTIRRYNANPEIVEEYLQEVSSIYEKGVDLEGNVLWEK